VTDDSEARKPRAAAARGSLAIGRLRCATRFVPVDRWDDTGSEAPSARLASEMQDLRRCTSAIQLPDARELRLGSKRAVSRQHYRICLHFLELWLFQDPIGAVIEGEYSAIKSGLEDLLNDALQ